MNNINVLLFRSGRETLIIPSYPPPPYLEVMDLHPLSYVDRNLCFLCGDRWVQFFPIGPLYLHKLGIYGASTRRCTIHWVARQQSSTFKWPHDLSILWEFGSHWIGFGFRLPVWSHDSGMSQGHLTYLPSVRSAGFSGRSDEHLEMLIDDGSIICYFNNDGFPSSFWGLWWPSIRHNFRVGGTHFRPDGTHQMTSLACALFRLERTPSPHGTGSHVSFLISVFSNW